MGLALDRSKLHILPLSQRESKTKIEDIAITGKDSFPLQEQNKKIIEKTARNILKAKENKAPIIIAFGAHLIKNGLGPLVKKFIEQGWVTHLAANGAVGIHDWEFAYQGKSEEDVRKYAEHGQFGIWKETGKYINLAILLAAAQNKGYGEAIGEMIHKEKLHIPPLKNLRDEINQRIINSKNAAGLVNLYETIKKLNIATGEYEILHPFKQYSVLEAAYKHKVPITIHPSFGQDIIYTHPLNSGAAIGITAEKDFLSYAHTVSKLEGGVYLSIGSAIMSPMIFEKSISMARNLAKQSGKEIKNFSILVNDIQKGSWEWGTRREPPKDNPAYYLRFCKTFDRMGAKEMDYLKEDNKAFLTALYQELVKRTQSKKIIAIEDIPRIRQGKTLVTTNGTFDILHLAHVKILQEAKKKGDLLLVLVNSDSSVKVNKGPSRPIITEKERMEMLASLECVDYVLKFDTKEVLTPLEQIKPNVHVKGGTHILERIKAEKDLVESYGGLHLCLGQIGNYSTTDIIEKIRESP